MADRGRGGRGGGRGGFQQQGFPSRGRADGGRGGFRGGFGGDRGRGGPRGGGFGGNRASAAPELFRQDGQIHPPRQDIQRLEDTTLKQDLTTRLQSLNIKSEAPLRPAYGIKGQHITLWANYFELLPSKNQAFNRYAIDLLPKGKGDEPKGKKRVRLVQLLLAQLPKNIAIASDYKSTILAASTLGFTNKEFLITYYPETEAGPGKNPPKYRARVQHTGTLTFETLLNYLSSTNLTQEKPAVKEEIIQATNIVLGHGMKSNSKIMTKRNKYFPEEGNLVEKWMLGHGLEAFRGFFMSVRAATGRILLNVQVQHIAVWEAIPLVSLFDKMVADRMSWTEINRAISGLWVHVTHLNKRLKRIGGLASPAEARRGQNAPQVPTFGANANQVKFWKDSVQPARYVSVAEHFKQEWKALNQPNAPVVNVGTRSVPVYLPSELCHVKKQQDYDKKLPPDATAAMIGGRNGGAVRFAPENARTISGNGISLLKQNSEKILNNFGVKIDTRMITVSARVLNGVPLSYSGKIQQPRDAGWNMRDIKFSKGAQMPAWSYVWVRTQQNSGSFRNMQEVAQTVNAFHVMLGTCGIQTTKPLPGKELRLNNPQDPDTEIDKFFSSVKGVRLLLVILPFQSTQIYNAVKRAADVKYGVHTVDVVGDRRKFAKAVEGGDNSQYFANVALKFNLKLGGHNQLLRPADLGFVSEGKTMLVGLDMTHPAPGSSESAPSVSSITASINAQLAQWPADVKIQTGRKEMIEGLKDMFKTRLQLWQKHNQQKLPEEIIVYRDGVGETMYDLVRTIELPQMKEACKEIYPATATKADKPYITIIICGKRHNTRFYPTSEQEADQRTGGTKNGTIVDRGVTEAREWDFYLQAHTALQGTPKSAHYVVVQDEIFRRRAAAIKSNDGRNAGQRAADELEALTHAMCYCFGRATKAISLAPPAYYADLICDRARRWLSRVFDERTVVSSEDGGEARPEDVQIHPNLRDTMFYI
ncbi:hypothetical protein PMZ80_001484 [Knufia obscura]|uniref:Piwi domain-containing protein n=1 Tax=Knufia obscura TaxID=1635080 RepID=A0ABR0S4Q4_9EURO|nr:hypothetical protein PMZ80_001484 [Knufia obscura]